jgi:hypothetical protein
LVVSFKVLFFDIKIILYVFFISFFFLVIMCSVVVMIWLLCFVWLNFWGSFLRLLLIIFSFIV